MVRIMIYEYIKSHPDEEIKSHIDEYYDLYTLYTKIFHRIDIMEKIISMTNSITTEDTYILSIAIDKINYELINKLIDKGVNMNCKMKYFKSHLYPLQFAMEKQNKSLFDFFVQNGSDVFICEHFLLFRCIIMDNITDFVEHIVSYYPDINVIIPHLDNRLLHMNFKKFEILLDAGLRLSEIDNKEIIYSIISCYEIDQLQYLVNNGLILVNKLLYYVAQDCNHNLAEYLLQYGLFFDKNVTYDIFFLMTTL